MKNIKSVLVKRGLFVVLAALIAVAFCGCSLFGVNGKPAVYISQSEIRLEEGSAVQLSAVTSDNSSVTWISTDDGVAAVSREGLVTGVSEGETVITAASASAMASCTIQVIKKATQGTENGEGSGEQPPITEIFTLFLDEIKMKTGESVILKATSSLGDEISWESSKPEVAKVNAGVVTALKAGSAVITAKTERASAECTVTVTQATVAGADKDGYVLVWNDEFDGNALDTSKWGYQTGTQDRYGSDYGAQYWGNNELQYYAQSAVSVADGSLKITASRQQAGDRPFTSGRILTRDKATWTYGYFEAKIKTPTGNGMWPAFWMLPQPSSSANLQNEYGGWPANGEIDIMEAKGRLCDKVDTTLHFGNDWQSHDYATSETQLSSNTDQWHTYAVDWSANSISWYVDGQKVFTVNSNRWWSVDSSIKGRPRPFDKPFYLIFNLAVGGQYDNYVEPDANFTSASMYVDYVRVYEKL